MESQPPGWVIGRIPSAPTRDGPAAWVSPYSKSRVVYIQLGHGESAHLYPAYRRLAQDAIRWTGGRRKGGGTGDGIRDTGDGARTGLRREQLGVLALEMDVNRRAARCARPQEVLHSTRAPESEGGLRTPKGALCLTNSHCARIIVLHIFDVLVLEIRS